MNLWLMNQVFYLHVIVSNVNCFIPHENKQISITVLQTKIPRNCFKTTTTFSALSLKIRLLYNGFEVKSGVEFAAWRSMGWFLVDFSEMYFFPSLFPLFSCIFSFLSSKTTHHSKIQIIDNYLRRKNCPHFCCWQNNCCRFNGSCSVPYLLNSQSKPVCCLQTQSKDAGTIFSFC